MDGTSEELTKEGNKRWREGSTKSIVEEQRKWKRRGERERGREKER
uniref:Uncharacterized protein n=1 Tax=Nelumbo nucifera TaxID=4432 RepID=A0A822XY70_NELNU|nr:TPA_asm: hypothetical protein HUJ06_025168 [Nelumbo nucifera]